MVSIRVCNIGLFFDTYKVIKDKEMTLLFALWYSFDEEGFSASMKAAGKGVEGGVYGMREKTLLWLDCWVILDITSLPCKIREIRGLKEEPRKHCRLSCLQNTTPSVARSSEDRRYTGILYKVFLRLALSLISVDIHIEHPRMARSTFIHHYKESFANDTRPKIEISVHFSNFCFISLGVGGRERCRSLSQRFLNANYEVDCISIQLIYIKLLFFSWYYPFSWLICSHRCNCSLSSLSRIIYTHCFSVKRSTTLL